MIARVVALVLPMFINKHLIDQTIQILFSTSKRKPGGSLIAISTETHKLRQKIQLLFSELKFVSRLRLQSDRDRSIDCKIKVKFHVISISISLRN